MSAGYAQHARVSAGVAESHGHPPGPHHHGSAGLNLELQPLSQGAELRASDVATFCRACWALPGARQRTGRLPRCAAGRHDMYGAITAVRWGDSGRHVWIAVRPPPDNVDVYAACEHSRRDKCPRRSNCPFSHTDPPEVEVYYWQYVKPLGARPAQTTVAISISQPVLRAQCQKEKRIYNTVQLQQQVMTCLQQNGSRLSLTALEAVLHTSLSASLESLKVQNLSEFLKVCNFAKQQGREVVLTIRDRVLHDIGRNVWCCAACWRGSPTKNHIVTAMTKRDQEGVVACLRCAVPWKPILIRRSRKTGAFFECNRISRATRVLAECKAVHLNDTDARACTSAHSEEELDFWQQEAEALASGVVTDVDEGAQDMRWCVLCECFVNAHMLKGHEESELHCNKARVAEACNAGYRYRVPVTGTRQSYGVNHCFDMDNCKKLGVACTHVHSGEEALEWEERRRRKRLGIACAENQPSIYNLGRNTDAIIYAAVLLVSVEETHEKLVTRMIAKSSAILHMRDREGDSILHVAVNTILRADADRRPAAFRVLQLLLDSGANVNARSKSGSTILHLSAVSDDLELTRRLIDLGVLLDTLANGGTAVQMAEAAEKPAQVEVLLRAGAKPSAPAATSTFQAEDHDSWLLGSKPVVPTNEKPSSEEIMAQLVLACEVDDAMSARTILTRLPLLVNAFGPCGRSLLHIAVHLRSYNVAQLLLKAGASPYILDKDGNTLLHLATKNLDVRSMRLLLKEDSLALFTENNESLTVAETLMQVARAQSRSEMETKAVMQAIEVLLDYDPNLSSLMQR